MSNKQNEIIIEDYLEYDEEDHHPNGERETERAEFIRDMLREDGEYTSDIHGQTV